MAQHTVSNTYETELLFKQDITALSVCHTHSVFV